MSDPNLQMRSLVTHPSRGSLQGTVVFINGPTNIHVEWPGDAETLPKDRPRYPADDLKVVGQRVD